MSAATDALKSMRAGYSKADPTSPEAPMARTIKLTDDEMGTLKGLEPGTDTALEVHGSLEPDGLFKVLSVAPMGAPDESDQTDGSDMAQQVAMRVTPTMQPSPS